MAAAGESEIGDEVAVEAVLLADVTALEGEGDEGEAGGDAEEQAGGVDEGELLQLAVVVEAVVDLAEGDAGDAAGDEAYSLSVCGLILGVLG